MFSIPDESVHRTKLADWMELKAVASPNARVGFATLASAAALAEDQQNPDIADEDKAEDQFILGVQAEIERRQEAVGVHYPFRIDPAGRTLEYVAPLSSAGAVYLFCLFISQAADRTIVSKKAAPKVDNKIRDLFQACATVAAAGFVAGPSKSFGFPRPDGSSFLKALHAVYALFGDGVPRKKPRAAAARAIKDNGIDIIAWRPSADKLPCTLYLIGQVASGNDWKKKSVIPDREHFHKYWFDVVPGSQPSDAMFMPFGLEPEDPEDGTAYQEVLADYMQGIGYKFGMLFYRDRIASHSAAGLELASGGQANIDRVADLARVEKWVRAYAKKLRDAA